MNVVASAVSEAGSIEVVGAITYVQIKRSCGHTEPLGGFVNDKTRAAWVASAIEEYSKRPCLVCMGKGEHSEEETEPNR